MGCRRVTRNSSDRLVTKLRPRPPRNWAKPLEIWLGETRTLDTSRETSGPFMRQAPMIAAHAHRAMEHVAKAITAANLKRYSQIHPINILMDETLEADPALISNHPWTAAYTGSTGAQEIVLAPSADHRDRELPGDGQPGRTDHPGPRPGGHARRRKRVQRGEITLDCHDSGNLLGQPDQVRRPYHKYHRLCPVASL